MMFHVEHKDDFFMNSSECVMQSMKNKSTMQKDVEGKTIILLENIGHVNDCISWINEINGEKIIIALTPYAMYELDKHDMTYNIPEDYYNPDELYQIGFGNFNKVEDLCNLIDATIQENCQEFRKLNIKPAMFNFIELKVLYDAITIRLFQLSKIINIEKPHVVYFYISSKHPFGAYESSPYLRFNRKESLYSQLLLLDEWGVSLKILPHILQYKNQQSETSNQNIFVDIKKNAKRWLLTHPELYDLALIMQKKGLSRFRLWFKSNFRKNNLPVLLFGAGYNWDDCIEEFRVEDIAPIYRILDDFGWLNKATKLHFDSLHFVWSQLQKNSEFRSFFILKDIDFYPLVEERFEFLVKQISIACLINVQDIEDLISEKDFKAVIASTFSTCAGHSVAQAAHNSKIPVITWQHGGYGAMDIHPFVNYCDLINSDAHFVFGDGVIDSYIKDAKRYGTKLIAVGSSSLECINYGNTIERGNTTSKEGKKILYVTSSYIQNNLNISTFPPTSDVLFWRTQKSIVDVLGKYNIHSVTIKLHPSNIGTHPLQSYAIDRGYNHFKFIQGEKSFEELLLTADALVIDLPFTTILQALTTKKQIFVYTGHVYYNKNAQKLLSKRAICCNNLNEFLCKLDKYLTDNVYKADLYDNEFLEMYGIAYNECLPTKRAPKELKEIIDKSRQLNNKCINS